MDFIITCFLPPIYSSIVFLQGVRLIYGTKRSNDCNYCSVSLCGFTFIDLLQSKIPFLLFCFALYDNLCITCRRIHQ